MSMTTPDGHTLRTPEQELIAALLAEREIRDEPITGTSMVADRTRRLDAARARTERALAEAPPVRAVEVEIEDATLDDSEGTIVWSYTVRLPEGELPLDIPAASSRATLLVLVSEPAEPAEASLPAGFELKTELGGLSAMCGGLGPAHCRKAGSCRRHNACVYVGTGRVRP